MTSGITVSLCSLVYLILLIGIVFSKKKVNSLENSIFKILVIDTFLVLLFDVLFNYFVNSNGSQILNIILSKGYLITSIMWCFYLLLYVLNVNSDKGYINIFDLFKKNRVSLVFFILTLVVCCGTLYFKTTFETKNGIFYQIGSANYFTVIVSFIYLGIMSIYTIVNPKDMSFKKRIPIFTFLLLYIIALAITWTYPYINFISSVMVFVAHFVYSTIENPDMKIINDLEKDKEEIVASSSAKTDFLSNMSHDIRTPMNAIIGFSESLLNEDLPEKPKEEVTLIHEAASTLLGIINNILDVSRIESGKEEKKETKFEIKRVVNNLSSVVTSKMNLQKIKFNVNVDNNVPEVLFGDDLKLYQILMNLLSNAVKYTEEGEIDFLISSENIGDKAHLKFVIKDTGMGIKESDYNKLFVKFSRIHNQENYKSIEGTGLGLVITKSLVELLGGSISFSSKWGQGTTFIVDMPMKIVSVASESPASLGNSQISSSQIHFDGTLYDILIVDDNELNLKVACRILSDYGFHITTAQSGEECLNLLKSGTRFDLIFLDHMMPLMDGIETFHNMKGLNVKIPPVVALTANAMVGMKEMFLAEGFDGYISKPISRDELKTLLDNIFCQR